MHCLAGLDRVDSGSVYLGEVDLSTLTERNLTRLRRDRIGFVFQAFNLLPALTAEENLLLPLRIAGLAPEPSWVEWVVGEVDYGTGWGTGRASCQAASSNGWLWLVL